MTFDRREDALSWINLVSDGYFSTMGMQLIAGRDFTAADRDGGPNAGDHQ